MSRGPVHRVVKVVDVLRREVPFKDPGKVPGDVADIGEHQDVEHVEGALRCKLKYAPRDIADEGLRVGCRRIKPDPPRCTEEADRQEAERMGEFLGEVDWEEAEGTPARLGLPPPDRVETDERVLQGGLEARDRPVLDRNCVLHGYPPLPSTFPIFIRLLYPRTAAPIAPAKNRSGETFALKPSRASRILGTAGFKVSPPVRVTSGSTPTCLSVMRTLPTTELHAPIKMFSIGTSCVTKLMTSDSARTEHTVERLTGCVDLSASCPNSEI